MGSQGDYGAEPQLDLNLLNNHNYAQTVVNALADTGRSTSSTEDPVGINIGDHLRSIKDQLSQEIHYEFEEFRHDVLSEREPPGGQSWHDFADTIYQGVQRMETYEGEISRHLLGAGVICALILLCLSPCVFSRMREFVTGVICFPCKRDRSYTHAATNNYV